MLDEGKVRSHYVGKRFQAGRGRGDEVADKHFLVVLVEQARCQKDPTPNPKPTGPRIEWVCVCEREKSFQFLCILLGYFGAWWDTEEQFNYSPESEQKFQIQKYITYINTNTLTHTLSPSRPSCLLTFTPLLTHFSTHNTIFHPHSTTFVVVVGESGALVSMLKLSHDSLSPHTSRGFALFHACQPAEPAVCLQTESDRSSKRLRLFIFRKQRRIWWWEMSSSGERQEMFERCDELQGLSEWEGGGITQSGSMDRIRGVSREGCDGRNRANLV